MDEQTTESPIEDIPGSDPSVMAEESPDDNRSTGTLATILLIVLIIIVILVLWRSCGSTTASGDRSGDDAVIAVIEELPEAEQAVSLWVKPDVSIEEVLRRNGLGDVEPIDMGDGTYVIGAAGDARALVEQLDADPGLYDAGFLYSED